MGESPRENAHQNSHFSPYIRGEKPALVIAENEHFMAIIEEKPLVAGHCVVFPKRVEDAFLHLSDDEMAGIMVFAKKVGQAIEKVVPCTKIGIAVIGLAVRHAHVHLVPIQSADDLNFTRPKLNLPEEELVQMAARIRSVLQN